MSKIKLNLAALSVQQKITLGTNIKTAMTGNTNFATPSPTLAAYGAATATLTAKNAAVVALQGQVKTAITDRNATEAAFDALTTLLAEYISNTSAGDPVKVESAGVSLKAAPAPIGKLGQVQNLSVTAGDSEGTLDSQWDPERGTKNYEIQISTDPNAVTSWRLVGSSGSSKFSLDGLTSGQKIWVRVRAKAPKKNNDGVWSDPAAKMVP